MRSFDSLGDLLVNFDISRESGRGFLQFTGDQDETCLSEESYQTDLHSKDKKQAQGH